MNVEYGIRSVVSLGLVVCLGVASPAEAGNYRSDRAGHPIRIAAYLLHPVGFLLDNLVYHPLWWISHSSLLAPVFGVAPRREPSAEEGIERAAMGSPAIEHQAPEPTEVAVRGYEEGEVSTRERIQRFLDDWTRSVASLDYDGYHRLGLRLDRDEFIRSYARPGGVDLEFELLGYEEPGPGVLQTRLLQWHVYSDGLELYRNRKERRIVLRDGPLGLRYDGTW